MVVLGGLNEGTWPGQTRLDPLLSRPMRAALALEPPERRIGLAAHDFAQALGHPEVWLTRADRQDGEPQRRLALAAAADRLCRRGAGRGDARARREDARAGAAASIAPRARRPRRAPRPSPPVELRPKRLSVTQIETLIRDPYAIYARHVLRLRPFEPLAKLPDAAERGTLIHDILERVRRASGRAGPFDAAAAERLLAIGPRSLRALCGLSRGHRRSGGRASSASRAGSCATEAARAGRRRAPRRGRRHACEVTPGLRADARAPTGSTASPTAGSPSSTTRPARRPRSTRCCRSRRSCRSRG